MKFDTFPLPPLNKVGWPWTIESFPLPHLMQNGNPWPKISIVTPSFNQGQFLEESIRSVLLQNYPNLEYIIMDGGSTDNSVEIIKKYEQYLTYWTSGQDKGQADAIYKGFELATGQIIAYINSDDYYLPRAFEMVARKFVKKNAEFLIGSCYHIDNMSNIVRKYYGFSQNTKSLLINGMYFCQQSCFWSREAFFSVGGFDRKLHYCFDYDLFLRLTEKYSPITVLKTLAVYRRHPNTKSMKIKDIANYESKQLLTKYNNILKIDNTLIKNYSNFMINKRLFGILSDIIFDPRWFIVFFRYHIKMLTNKLAK
ncbi:MAG: glycosyltransferase [Ignavibacterium sp.]|nr:glycosyltransferase [Ignavibacterium sp.]